MTSLAAHPLLRKYLLPLILIMGLCLTVYLAWRAHTLVEHRQGLRFENEVTELSHLVTGRMDNYVALLRGAAGLLQHPELRTRSLFASYVSALHLDEIYPGIQGIGLAHRMDPAETATFEQEITRMRGERFRVWPLDGQSSRFPIVVLEPEEDRNRRAIGYDMFSEPIRREAMQRAWDWDEPAASGRVTLVQEAEDQQQAGFLIYLPLWTAGVSKNDPEAFVGFVYSPFRASDLFHGIFPEHLLLQVGLEVYDGARAEPSHLLYAHPPRNGDREIIRVTQRHIDVAGRTWTLVFSSNEDSLQAPTVALWLAGIGFILTVLLYLLVRNLEREHRHAQEHAEALAASERAGQANQALKQAVLDAALDCIITVDQNGRVVEFNPAAERVFGHRRNDAIGQPIVDLIVPERKRERHVLALQQQVLSGSGEALARRVEMIGRRADGAEFPAELTIVRLEVHGHPLYTAYLRDITERVRAAAEIQTLNESLEQKVRSRTAELEDLNRHLESFSYSVSHDLRAPARNIRTFGELLQRKLEAQGDAASERIAHIIVDASRRMGQLIDDLLAFARTSREPFHRRPVDMQDVVHEVIRLLAPQIGDRRLDWQIAPLPQVEGDRALLAQVWVNLISNAVKYTRRRAEATIMIDARIEATETIFRIADNGVGFDMKYAHKLFQVFERLHRQEDFEGSGIGLANVARIIQRHGGRVWVEATPDVGATFYFSIPHTTATPPSV
jgi:PAS domain S-box-containing protein